ncbi:MAG: hypothetical protein ABIO04_00115 [Ferruginibacter sp.]
MNKETSYKILEDPLKTFKVYEILIAAVCIFIPLILRFYDNDKVYPVKVNFLRSGIIIDSVQNIKRSSSSISGTIQIIDKDRWHFRTSISDYAYSTNSYLFGMLLCIAAMLFIFNGAVYFKSQRSVNVNKQGKWYIVFL